MKRKAYLVVLLFSLALLPLNGYSQFTETREFTKRYKIEKDARVEITNKYGKVEINTWEKDSAVFIVKIKVEERKLSKLEYTMDGIDFDFTGSAHFLVARALVNNNQTPLEKEFMKLKETMLPADSRVEIDMDVWLPQTCNLYLDNKFGDIYIAKYNGDATITLSNGNLKAHELTGKLALNLNFANATVSNLANARLVCNYSDIYIKTAESLQVESKQSTFEITEIKRLNAASRRDKFSIREAGLIEASGSFTGFRVYELNDRLDIRSSYGDIDIQKINAAFSNIYIQSESTDINLYFSREANFGFEITNTKSETDFCREMEVKEKAVLDEKIKKSRDKGFFGKKTNEKEKLFINATSGAINIFSY